jgi:hypothetical protein
MFALYSWISRWVTKKIEPNGELISAANNPDEKHQYRNKGDVSFKKICGVPKEFE